MHLLRPRSRAKVERKACSRVSLRFMKRMAEKFDDNEYKRRRKYCTGEDKDKQTSAFASTLMIIFSQFYTQYQHVSLPHCRQPYLLLGPGLDYVKLFFFLTTCLPTRVRPTLWAKGWVLRGGLRDRGFQQVSCFCSCLFCLFQRWLCLYDFKRSSRWQTVQTCKSGEGP